MSDEDNMQPAPPEVQQLFAEAMFWKQKYFEQLQHSTQVIGMLTRPPASAEQIANVVQLHPAEDGENGAQEPPQPQEQPNRAARRRKTT